MVCTQELTSSSAGTRWQAGGQAATRGNGHKLAELCPLTKGRIQEA